MGKIVKKKKGRPSKVDLVRRGRNPGPGSDQRRSLRSRNLTYTEDFDDDEEDEQESRREKKLKLVLRLPHNKSVVCSRVDSVTSLTRTSGGGAVVSASSSEYGDGNKPFKKRKIDGDDDVCSDGDRDDDEEDGDDDDDDDDEDDDKDVRSNGSDDERKERKRNADPKAMDSVQGLPLPDGKLLELILDKLQKKDTYGVYAEPVDPEELPDYHDVVEHPMDFGTIRKKLASGTYSNFEQFENDVFLVCTNAMKYNAPETIYFKQARSIQELARKKFQRLRIEIEHTEAELKSEQKTKSNNCSEKKPIKKSSCRTVQEPVGSDFSSGATLATAGETCILSAATQAGVCERPSNVDIFVDGNSSLTENKPEKAEEQLLGKGLPSKFGKKPFVVDDNRRATYNVSNQPVVRNESIFTTFEGENKQFIAVGLHSDHSYARSLARFAATLGPIAWRVASKRIEQALPVGFKFGRGWVGEYEPLPTPVLMLGNGTHKQPVSNLQNASESRKDDRTAARFKATQNDMRLSLRTSSSGVEVSGMSPKESPRGGPISEGRLGLFGVTGAKPFVNSMYQQQNSLPRSFAKSDGVLKQVELNPIDVSSRKQLVHSSEGKQSPFSVAGTKPMVNPMYQQQNPLSMNLANSANVVKQVELNSSSSACRNPINNSSQKQLEYSSEIMTSKQLETDSRNRNLVQFVPFKQPESDEAISSGIINRNKHRVSRVNSPSDFVSNQQTRAATYFPRENHEQGLNDPVLMMRMLAEKTRNQQKPTNPAPIIDGPQVMPSISSSRRDDSSATTSAAREWMTLGTAQFKPTESIGSPKLQIAPASLYSSTRERSQSVSQFCGVPENRFPPQAFLPQHVRVGNEQLQNNGQMVFPQLVTTDIPRFQVQSPWRGLVPHIQTNKKQDTLPPDLNISFQPSGSPVSHSSGVLVDSQQPDLALQL